MTLAANRSTKVYYFLGFLVGFFREETLDFHIATIRMVSVTASLSPWLTVVVFVSFSIRSCYWCSKQAVFNKRAQGQLLW